MDRTTKRKREVEIIYSHLLRKKRGKFFAFNYLILLPAVNDLVVAPLVVQTAQANTKSMIMLYILLCRDQVDLVIFG